MKLFEKRWFRLLLNGLCSVMILIIGIIFINVGLKDIGSMKENLTIPGYFYAIAFSIISFVIYLLFDFRNYQNEDGVIKKGFTAIVYFLLWAALVFIAFVCCMIIMAELLGYSPASDGKLNNLEFYTCFSLLSFGFSALFTQLILEKCSFAKQKTVEKRKKYAPFASFIGFVIAFVIFGVLGILMGNNETLRTLLVFVESLAPFIGFIIVCIKKFKKRGEKKLLDKSASNLHSNSREGFLDGNDDLLEEMLKSLNGKAVYYDDFKGEMYVEVYGSNENITVKVSIRDITDVSIVGDRTISDFGERVMQDKALSNVKKVIRKNESKLNPPYNINFVTRI